jgi:predicted dehydrogenase
MDVGVIGVGVMGKNHVRIYSEMRGVDSLSIYDVNSPIAKALGEKYGATVYGTTSELLDNCDAVSVVVPTQFHAAIVSEVFRKKKSVLIEKPICSTSDEAKRMMKTAPEGITVGIGHIERFNPIVSEIKKIVKNPLYFEMKRHNPTSSRITGGSVVEDLMIHDIDILLNEFFPEPCDVHSVGNADVMSVLMKSNNIPISMSASRKASKKIRLFYIEDEDFTIEGDFMSQEVTIYRKPGQYRMEAERYVQENIIEKVMVGKVEPLKRELETFIDCVDKQKPFPITPAQAINNLEFCEKVRTAI